MYVVCHTIDCIMSLGLISDDNDDNNTDKNYYNKKYYEKLNILHMCLFSDGVKSIKVWSKVDNVDIDAKTGDLWIGTHPNMYVILNHLGDPTAKSPSQVTIIDLYRVSSSLFTHLSIY